MFTFTSVFDSLLFRPADHEVRIFIDDALKFIYFFIDLNKIIHFIGYRQLWRSAESIKRRNCESLAEELICSSRSSDETEGVIGTPEFGNRIDLWGKGSRRVSQQPAHANHEGWTISEGIIAIQFAIAFVYIQAILIHRKFLFGAVEFGSGRILLPIIRGEGRTTEFSNSAATVRAELHGIRHQTEGSAILFDHPNATFWQKLQNVSAHFAISSIGRHWHNRRMYVFGEFSLSKPLIHCVIPIYSAPSVLCVRKVGWIRVQRVLRVIAIWSWAGDYQLL